MNHSSHTGNGLIQENRSGTTCGIAKHSQTVLSKFYYKKRTKIKLRSRCICVYTAVKMVLGGFKYIQYIQTYLLYSTNYVHIKYHACICTLQCSTWEILWRTTMRWWDKDKKRKEEQKGTGSPPPEASLAQFRLVSGFCPWIPFWLLCNTGYGGVGRVLCQHFHLYGLVCSSTAERYAFWSGLALTWSWGCKWKGLFEIVQSFLTSISDFFCLLEQ